MLALSDRLARLLRNAVLDLRYGGWLGGSEQSRFAHTGARDVMNTDYRCLEYIFPDGEIRLGETLVDLGCGRGRVLNWWLSRYGNRVKIIGVELDPDIAERTRKRLARYRNVAVITGSAPDILRELEPDVVFMFNPFGEPYMSQVEAVARTKRARIYFWSPSLLDVWRNPHWSVDFREAPTLYGGHPLAKIAPVAKSRRSPPRA